MTRLYKVGDRVRIKRPETINRQLSPGEIISLNVAAGRPGTVKRILSGPTHPRGDFDYEVLIDGKLFVSCWKEDELQRAE